MEKISCDIPKSRSQKNPFHLNPPKTERPSLGGDRNGCVLVIPQLSRMNKDVKLRQGGLSEFHL